MDGTRASTPAFAGGLEKIDMHPRAAKRSFWFMALGAVTLLSLVPIFYDGVIFLVQEWDSPEYSHGVLIPLVSLFMAWRKRSSLLEANLTGSWAGVVVLAFSLLLALAGVVGTIYLLIHIAILGSIVGLVLAFFGWRAINILWFPLVYLVFMIPLPDFFQVKLSGEMQLISSTLGVTFIRAFEISVFLEGNVIDLGDFKMQVVEACSGLRYLFPLMSFGFLIGYLHQGPIWQKGFIFLSTIPITLVMNSARIAAIGIIFEYSGTNAAEGFLHDFEGWAVFIICIAVLVVELMIFSLINRRGKKRSSAAAAKAV